MINTIKVPAMGLFGKLFKKKNGDKNENVPTKIEVIKNLRKTEEMLEKKKTFLKCEVHKENETAKKQHANKNKRGMTFIIASHSIYPIRMTR